MLDEKEYRIPVEALKKICDARQLHLSDFFRSIENDKFYSKLKFLTLSKRLSILF